MKPVLLVIHLFIAAGLVGLILVQRSEGGALGMGGGPGGLMTGRAAANMLTRATSVLAAAFFATSILLTVLSGGANQPTSVFDDASETGVPEGGDPIPVIETPTVPTED